MIPDPLLESLMQKVETWRINKVSSICANHQSTAFHIGVLTEEKFRMYALTGFTIKQESMRVHVHMRKDIFATEWALRALQIPSQHHTDIKDLRNTWSSDTADKCMKILADLSNYYHIRDLVVCTKRGGYIVENPDEHTFIFRDNPNWIGVEDIKSRIISDSISEERNKNINLNTSAGGSLRTASLYEDFPHNLRTSRYTGADFWCLWECLFNLAQNNICDSCRVNNYGSYAATSETKRLTILITKRKMMNQLAQKTGLSKSIINIFLEWLTFNSQTPRKFTLFHCPLIEINDKFFMLLPHIFLLSHVPTVFLRLLAHYDKSAFNSASSDLEKQTLCRLRNHLENQDHIIKTNIKLDTAEESAEFDYIEYDESNSTLSIGQAKLTVRADSVSEVDHTNEMLKIGLAQLERDKSILEKNAENIKNLLNKLDVRPREDVRIEYFLIPTHFTGSDFLEIPTWIKVIPIEFCLQPKYKGFSIRSIWNQYRDLSDSIDSKATSSKIQSEFEIAGFKISYPGFVI